MEEASKVIDPAKKRESKTGLVMILMLITGFVAVFLLEKFVVQIDTINGVSMMPTLQNGETVLVDKVIYHFEKPQYGDVIAIPYGTNGIIKRVIGLPGDKIQITGGNVYRNGQKLDEPYIAAKTLGTYGPIKVPAGTVFLLGDNRNESRDSRSFGAVPIGSIIGRADIIAWPLKDFTFGSFGKNVSGKPLTSRN